LIRKDFRHLALRSGGSAGHTDRGDQVTSPQDDRLEELLRAHGRRLYALLYRLTLSMDAADDLLQELYLRLMKTRLDRVSRVEAYATRVAIHLAMDWRSRGARAASSISQDPLEPGLGPIEQVEIREDVERTLDAVRELRAPLREIVVLRYIEGQRYESIASALGKTPQQVRGLASKAIKSLRESLSSDGRAADKESSHARKL
jgi:RNA polymerase sigma-70 factor (ECF subfamily)